MPMNQKIQLCGVCGDAFIISPYSFNGEDVCSSACLFEAIKDIPIHHIFEEQPA